MSDAPAQFLIGIPVYPGFDLMDMAAPYETLNWMATEPQAPAGTLVQVLGPSTDPVASRDFLSVTPHAAYEDVPHLDVLWVPGGSPDALAAQIGDADYMDRLRGWARTATYVVSVCEGAVLLAAAGLLDGYRATTHWAFLPCLKSYPDITVVGGRGHYPRWVLDRGHGAQRTRAARLTGAGISAGLDEALKLVELLAGKQCAKSVQTTMQYFPKPPVDAKIRPGRHPSCPVPGWPVPAAG
jgi:transcriptional regulator GlxA family with amidase domain